MERNFETVMIEQCAPVLASLKPAGLFRYETRDCADLAARVRRWNDQLGEKGLKVRVLKGCAQTHRYLIYVYRESRLRQVLADDRVAFFSHHFLWDIGRHMQNKFLVMGRCIEQYFDYSFQLECARSLGTSARKHGQDP